MNLRILSYPDPDDIQIDRIRTLQLARTSGLKGLITQIGWDSRPEGGIADCPLFPFRGFKDRKTKGKILARRRKT
jgi:hypothetical protein